MSAEVSAPAPQAPDPKTRNEPPQSTSELRKKLAAQTEYLRGLARIHGNWATEVGERLTNALAIAGVEADIATQTGDRVERGLLNYYDALNRAAVMAVEVDATLSYVVTLAHSVKPAE